MDVNKTYTETIRTAQSSARNLCRRAVNETNQMLEPLIADKATVKVEFFCIETGKRVRILKANGTNTIQLTTVEDHLNNWLRFFHANGIECVLRFHENKFILWSVSIECFTQSLSATEMQAISQALNQVKDQNIEVSR